MITKFIHVVLHDGPQISPTKDLLPILEKLQQNCGMFIWCRKGEYRAIGGSRIKTWCRAIELHDSLRDNYTIADSQLRQFYSLEWNMLHSIDPTIVHWLREEAEQLGETDTTTQSTTE